jgi:hypothetical protein
MHIETALKCLGLESPHPLANDCYEGDRFYWFQFGAYRSTIVGVFAESAECAFELAVEWLDDNAPGLLVSHEEFAQLLKESAEELGVDCSDGNYEVCNAAGVSVLEHAERDLTSIGHTSLKHGSYIISDEWAFEEVFA